MIYLVIGIILIVAMILFIYGSGKVARHIKKQKKQLLYTIEKARNRQKLLNDLKDLSKGIKNREYKKLLLTMEMGIIDLIKYYEKLNKEIEKMETENKQIKSKNNVDILFKFREKIKLLNNMNQYSFRMLQPYIIYITAYGNCYKKNIMYEIENTKKDITNKIQEDINFRKYRQDDALKKLKTHNTI